MGARGSAPALKVSPDGNINFNDQMAFTVGWNGEAGTQDPLADVGPATGTVPDLLSNPDGQWNVDDILVFTQMYSWAADAGFTGSSGGGSALSAGRLRVTRPAPLGAAGRGRKLEVRRHPGWWRMRQLVAIQERRQAPGAGEHEQHRVGPLDLRR